MRTGRSRGRELDVDGRRWCRWRRERLLNAVFSRGPLFSLDNPQQSRAVRPSRRGKSASRFVLLFLIAHSFFFSKDAVFDLKCLLEGFLVGCFLDFWLSKIDTSGVN